MAGQPLPYLIEFSPNQWIPSDAPQDKQKSFPMNLSASQADGITAISLTFTYNPTMSSPLRVWYPPFGTINQYSTPGGEPGLTEFTGELRGITKKSSWPEIQRALIKASQARGDKISLRPYNIVVAEDEASTVYGTESLEFLQGMTTAVGWLGRPITDFISAIFNKNLEPLEIQ